MRINHLAVAASALAYWVLGAVWYSRLLFERPFISLKGWTPEQVEAIRAAGAGKEVGLALLSSFAVAYVLAHFVRYVGAERAGEGAKVGFWLWLGFVATTNSATVLFEGRPFGLYLINVSYNLVAFLGMGAVLAVWKKREARHFAYQS